jgi:hypothetical protein
VNVLLKISLTNQEALRAQYPNIVLAVPLHILGYSSNFKYVDLKLKQYASLGQEERDDEQRIWLAMATWEKAMYRSNIQEIIRQRETLMVWHEKAAKKAKRSPEMKAHGKKPPPSNALKTGTTGGGGAAAGDAVPTTNKNTTKPPPISDKRASAAAVHAVNAASGNKNDRAAALAAAILRGVTMRPSGKWVSYSTLNET